MQLPRIFLAYFFGVLSKTKDAMMIRSSRQQQIHAPAQDSCSGTRLKGDLTLLACTPQVQAMGG